MVSFSNYLHYPGRIITIGDEYCLTIPLWMSTEVDRVKAFAKESKREPNGVLLENLIYSKCMNNILVKEFLLCTNYAFLISGEAKILKELMNVRTRLRKKEECKYTRTFIFCHEDDKEGKNKLRIDLPMIL